MFEIGLIVCGILTGLLCLVVEHAWQGLLLILLFSIALKSVLEERKREQISQKKKKTAKKRVKKPVTKQKKAS